MKKFTCFFTGLCTCTIILFCGQLNGQTVQIGTGTDVTPTTLYSPVYRFSATSTTTACRSNILFTQAELQAAGITTGATINALAFNKVNTAQFLVPANFKIYIGNTSNTTLPTTTTWASILASHTEVYTNTAFNVNDAPGWNTWIITPYVYTGGTLEIATDLIMTGGTNSATGPFQWEYTSAVSANYIVGAASTNATTLNGTAAEYKRRPNTRITFTAPGPCTAPPIAGVAVASPSTTVCANTPVSLNINGYSSGNGQTFIWQSAPASGGPFTDITTSSILPFTTVSPSVTTFYRAIVTCSGQSTNTAPIQITATQGISGIYTINSASATGGSNFQTFTAAISALSCGLSGPVTFNVDASSGPYTEQFTIPVLQGASSTNTLTINGNGRTVQFAPITGARHIIRLDGADYVTINNLNIVSTDIAFGWGIHLINAANFNTINNCTINMSAVTSTTQSNSAGVVASNSATSVTTQANNANNTTITGNTITGAYQGIILNGASATLSASNNISNNTIGDFYAVGIYLYYNNGTIIKSNDISRLNRTTVTTFEGITLVTGNVSLLIDANKIHNTHNAGASQTGTSYGIFFSGCDAVSGQENIVSNNLIYNFNSGSGTQYGLYNSSSDYVWYYHNTVALENATSTAGTTRGFFQITTATGIILKNNIIKISRGGTGDKYLLYFGATTTASTITSDNNDLLISSTAGNNYTGYLALPTPATNHTTLAEWRTASAQDAASVVIDPLFNSAASGNYTPFAPTLNNLGVPVSITTDINNAARSATTPDIGAYEFNVGGCTSPPIPGTASATPAGSVCQGTLVSLNLTGNSFGTGQTYQWQSSPTSGSGFTNVGTALSVTLLEITANTTLYYRCSVTCSGSTVNSTEVLVTVPALYPAGTYTINSALPTAGTNFQTFAEAMGAINCGIAGAITFNVDAASGPYNEQVIIPQITGANAANRIVINGNDRILSFLSTNTNERAGIKLLNADFVTINNLTITATGTLATEYGFGIQLLGDADNNIINNCRINLNNTSTSTNYTGIAITNLATSATATGGNSENNVISNNTINGGYYGITVIGLSTALIQNNKITGNTILDIYTYGIYINATDGTLIEKNDISRPARIAASDFIAIYFTGLGANAKISKNRIHDPYAADLTDASSCFGIYFSSSDAVAGSENIVSNNLIYNLNGGGIQYAFYNIGSDGVFYYHNTVTLDDAAYTGTAATRGFFQTTTAAGIEFKNNIIRISRGGAGLKHVLYFGATTTASTIVSNNNDLFITNAATHYIGYLALPTPAANFATISLWRTASNQDAASVVNDPLFADVISANFTPREILLDNLGSNAGITTDVLDATRSTATPDIGAYEFTGSITLPVKLINLFATRLKNDVLINWATSLELNSDYYEIERSFNGINFSYAGNIRAANNSNGSTYKFTDYNIVNQAIGASMFYRLKMKDKDGRFEYSPVVRVKLDKELITSVQAAPNPFINNAIIKINTPVKLQFAEIRISNMNGQVLYKIARQLQEGTNLVRVEKSNQLPAGIYIATILLDDEQFIIKLIKK